MLRKLDSEIFTYLTQALGNEVSEISSMKSELLIAQSGNWSDEFIDDEASGVYSQISQILTQRNMNIIEHQIYLGKRGTALRRDDSEAATSLTALLDEFQDYLNKSDALAKNAAEGANQLETGNININVLYTEEEVDFIKNAFSDYSYDVFLTWTYKEKLAFGNKVIDYIQMVYIDGLLPMPENDKVTIRVAPGITAYFSVSKKIKGSAKDCTIDFKHAKEACVKLLKTGDFNTLSLSLNIDGKVSATLSEEYDENSSIYSSSGYYAYNNSFFLENGTTVSVPVVADGDTSIEASVTMACGVEITPLNAEWLMQNAYAYAYNSEYPVIIEESGIKDEDVGMALAIAGIGILIYIFAPEAAPLVPLIT